MYDFLERFLLFSNHCTKAVTPSFNANMYALGFTTTDLTQGLNKSVKRESIMQFTHWTERWGTEVISQSQTALKFNN